MAHTSTRIYIDISTNPDTGISINDAQVVLPDNSNDIGNLERSSNINKWAKYKPIRYYTMSGNTKVPYLGILTDAMRKGTVIDNNAGIYYGLQLSDVQVTQDTATWDNIHDSDFTYLPPRGFSQGEAFRFHDWDGYSSNAVPNPYASFNSAGTITGYYDSVNGITGITVGYSEANQTGVDLSDILIASENKQAALAQMYPCIIIDGYITALGFEDDPNHAPRPLYYQNSYTSGTWMVDMTKLVYSNHPTTRPWTSAQTGLTATIVLLRSSSSSGIALDRLGTQDLSQYWIDCSDSILSSYTPIALPGAIGVTVNLITSVTGLVVTPTGATGESSGNTITATFDIQRLGSTVTGRATLTASMIVGNSPVDTCEKNILFASSATQTSVTITCGIGTEFDLQDTYLMRGSSYKILLDVTATPGNNQRSATFEFTAS